MMRAAIAATRENADGILTITTIPTFAANWLVPRLGSFQLAQPSLAVRLQATREVIDFSRQDADIGIRSGSGRWPGMVCAQDIRCGLHSHAESRACRHNRRRKNPDDLLKLPIVDPSDPWWKIWFAAAGVPDPDLRGDPRSRFGDQHLEGKAVIAGQGVGILTPAFYETELAQGQLIQPFDIVGNADHFYWLVYPEARRNVPKIRAFRDWLLGQLEDK